MHKTYANSCFLFRWCACVFYTLPVNCGFQFFAIFFFAALVGDSIFFLPASSFLCSNYRVFVGIFVGYVVVYAFMPQYLNILLQKNDSNLSWGFEVAGGGRAGVPLIITKVHPNSFCSQYLSPEDRIIRIEGIDVELLSEAEALSFVKKPGRSLNLLVHKRAPTICPQHHPADDASSESSTSSSGTALRHDNLRSSFRSYFDRKYDTHRDFPTSPPSRRAPPEALQTPPSPRFASRWSRDPTATPPNADLRGHRGVHWWDTGASSSSYSSSALEDSENERSYDEFRLGPDDEVDFGGFQQETRNWAYKGQGTGSSNESVAINSRNLSTGAVNRTIVHSPIGEPSSQVKSQRAYTVRSVRSEDDDKRNISRVYLSPFGAKINLNDPNVSRNFDQIGRQTSQTADQSVSPPAPPSNGTCTVPVTHNIGAPPPPPAPPAPSGFPAPPPPPPPALNGGVIPTIRLKSEIPERPEPPAKLQNAMMKDKKPFTYTPGGIDLSEIKSPRMARRVMLNAQEPEDVVLPPTTSTPVSPATLPPSAIAAMCPQIAIPVFPQNGIANRKPLNSHRNGHVAQTPPPPPPKQPTPASSPTPPSKVASTAPPTNSTVSFQNGSSTAENKPKTVTPTPSNSNRAQVGSIYIPPVGETDKSKPSTPTFPTLREAPTPWLNKHQQQQPAENVPPWRTRNSQDRVTKDVEQENKPGPVQIKVNMEPESNKSANGGRVIPIQIEGAAPKINPSNRWGNAKDNNETAQSTINNRATDSKPKPSQSSSFRVLQMITGSEDDSTDAPYNSEGVPVSQLRKLHLNDDDQAFMSKVKAQDPLPPFRTGKSYDNGDAESFTTESNYSDDWVDEDTFLHMETDPRYRGSVIPSRAFRMLQNMTDSGQVTSNNVVVIPINQTNNTNYNQPKQSQPVRNTVEVQVAPPSQPVAIQQDIETKRNYIPPSERQAEQDLRKYMGSSIPSRSFRMLQAMTATQDSTDNVNEIATNIDEENMLSSKIPFLPNPWTSPPQRPADVISLWKNYRILYDFVFQQLPHLLVENYNGDSIIPNSLSHPMRANDPKNSTNIAIVVTDEENLSSQTLNTRNSVQRPTSPGRRLRPHFHSEILEPHHDPKKSLIITQTLTDGNDNDVSVTVRIPLRRRPSTPTDYHSEITLTKDFMSEDARSRPNGVKILPIEYASKSDASYHNNHDSKIFCNTVEDKPDNKSTKSSHMSNLKNIMKVYSNHPINDSQETFASSSDNKNNSGSSQMLFSRENGLITNSSNKDESNTHNSRSFKNQNSIRNDKNSDENVYDFKMASQDSLSSSTGFRLEKRMRSATPCVFEAEKSTGQGNSEDLDPNYLHNPRSNSSQQLNSVQFSEKNGNDSDLESFYNFRKYNDVPSFSHNKPVLEESTNLNKDYFKSTGLNSPHSTQLTSDKRQEENGIEDSIARSSSKNFDSTNRSHQLQDPIKSLLKASDDPQSESFSENSDSSDNHSDASSVDFWKEIAENEDDLFFKTSRSKSTTEQLAENSKPVWNLGKDVRDFCNYTELSDCTDTSSTSSGGQNKDSFDRSNQNETTSSCSSDENESYNVYNFNEDKLSNSIPPREDVKAECIHLEDDVEKEGGTDVDEDSGMNSDTGRNCSETEAESEAAVVKDSVKPNIKYERARTHSRLYRLLLAEEKKPSKLNGCLNPSKQSLMLPLNGNLSFVESLSSSSGINSPMSPVVNEKLVNELVQNVLKWKNGPDLSKFSIEKLREIAIRSLQAEGTDSSRGSSPYSPFLMANDPELGQSDTHHFDFSNTTKELADSNALYYPGFDVCPSPAFKTLQSGRNSPKTWPKCPLVSKSRSYLSK